MFTHHLGSLSAIWRFVNVLSDSNSFIYYPALLIMKAVGISYSDGLCILKNSKKETVEVCRETCSTRLM